MTTTVHIISFDVPFPADYGGVIDVYHKIRLLKKNNVKVILHCFEYGRGMPEELSKLCELVYYYKRKHSILNFLSKTPYIVSSRSNDKLLKNLQNDNHPILFEGLHTCLLMNHPELKKRQKIFRESNIEHEYYKGLALSERNIFKKIFFLIEAFKLKKFESVLINSQLILTVSKKDTEYFKQKFPLVEVKYIPSFHAYDHIHSKEGIGKYVLYHGKLSVNENHSAAVHLIKTVFSKIKTKVIVAGMNPKPELIELVSVYSNIELISNPNEETMNALISNAQVNCLYTHQETGLKLKLIYALFSGRHVLCNEKMTYGTGLDNLVLTAKNEKEFLDILKKYSASEFSSLLLKEREQKMPDEHKNERKIQLLLEAMNT